MKEWKVIIVDDEKKSTDIIEYMVNKHCANFQIQEIFNQPKTAIEYIKNNTIDLLFLDIQMPEIDGFQLLDTLEVINFNVVFITAYDEYALRAFKYFAIDYILKPIVQEELINLSNRLTEKETHRYNKKDFMELFAQMQLKTPVKDQLAVPTASGVVFIRFDDIIRLQADSNYSYIYRADGTKVYAAKTLKYFENLLPSDAFFRPHQSHIINLKYMEEFVRQDGGYIKMKEGKEIILARSKRQEFLDRFV